MLYSKKEVEEEKPMTAYILRSIIQQTTKSLLKELKSCSITGMSAIVLDHNAYFTYI